MSHVHRLSVKDSHRTEKRGHGLQKSAVDRLVVRVTGCEGDYNQFRTSHKQSTPDRAVSLITTSILDELTHEGWGPVLPGDLGENITVTGDILFEPGQIVSIGPDAVLEIAELIVPCNKLMFLPYVGRERKAAFLKTLQGRRGWYARVLSEGTIHPGDKVK